jgi:aspartyl protease family protein
LRSATKHMLLEAMQWGALVLGIVAVIYFFDDIRAVFRPNGLPTLAQALRDRPAASERKESGFDREVRLRADANGHFLFKAAVNGRLADFVADTGATYVVITYDDAERLGLSPHTLDFSAPVQTANGVTPCGARDPGPCACGRRHDPQRARRRGRKGRACDQPPRHELSEAAQELQ